MLRYLLIMKTRLCHIYVKHRNQTYVKVAVLFICLLFCSFLIRSKLQVHLINLIQYTVFLQYKYLLDARVRKVLDLW